MVGRQHIHVEGIPCTTVGAGPSPVRTQRICSPSTVVKRCMKRWVIAASPISPVPHGVPFGADRRPRKSVNASGRSALVRDHGGLVSSGHDSTVDVEDGPRDPV